MRSSRAFAHRHDVAAAVLDRPYPLWLMDASNGGGHSVLGWQRWEAAMEMLLPFLILAVLIFAALILLDRNRRRHGTRHKARRKRI